MNEEIMSIFSLERMYSGYKNITAFFFFWPILKCCFYGFPLTKWLSWDKSILWKKWVWISLILHYSMEILSMTHSVWTWGVGSSTRGLLVCSHLKSEWLAHIQTQQVVVKTSAQPERGPRRATCSFLLPPGHR